MKNKVFVCACSILLIVSARVFADDAAAPAPADSASASSDAACNARVKDYASGDLSSQALGARTWHLSRLAKASLIESDACAKKMLARGVGEAEAYWNHIGQKFKCTDAAGRVHANHTCSPARAAQVKLNLNYLKIFKFAADDPATARSATEAAVCDEACKKLLAAQALNAQNQENLRTIARAVTTVLPEPAPVADTATVVDPALKGPKPQPVSPMPPKPAMKNRSKTVGSSAMTIPLGPAGLTARQLAFYNIFNSNRDKALAKRSSAEDDLHAKISKLTDTIQQCSKDSTKCPPKGIAGLKAQMQIYVDSSSDMGIAFSHLGLNPSSTENATKPVPPAPDVPVPKPDPAPFNQVD